MLFLEPEPRYSLPLENEISLSSGVISQLEVSKAWPHFHISGLGSGAKTCLIK